MIRRCGITHRCMDIHVGVLFSVQTMKPCKKQLNVLQLHWLQLHGWKVSIDISFTVCQTLISEVFIISTHTLMSPLAANSDVLRLRHLRHVSNDCLCSTPALEPNNSHYKGKTMQWSRPPRPPLQSGGQREGKTDRVSGWHSFDLLFTTHPVTWAPSGLSVRPRARCTRDIRYLTSTHYGSPCRYKVIDFPPLFCQRFL